MKMIFRIAKSELRTLFYSPIAWLLLLVFWIQCSQLYLSPLGRVLEMQEQGYTSGLHAITAQIFGPPFGVFVQVLANLYLYIPLLTMGLMSRETSSGTIKLLYSSPIKISQIIFGKYLAVITYCALLVLILLTFVFFSLFHVQYVDYGFLLVGILGIFLLLCTYSAIGLFMSCLTSYQVVAAISTLVMLALLKYIGSVWQGLDFVRNLTYFLAVNDRTDHMLSGLLATNDIIYFLLIICTFLSISIIKLQFERKSTSLILVAGKYGLVILSALALGYLSDLPGNIGYHDATATRSQTASRGVQRILSGMNQGPLEVTTYVNLLDQTYYLGDPATRLLDLDRWKPYLRFKPDIKLNYTYYYDTLGVDPDALGNFPGKNLKQIAEKKAKIYKVDIDRFLSPEKIRKLVNLRQEKSRYVVSLKYRGKQTFLRVYNDQTRLPTDQEVGAALKRLIVTLPKIAFLQDEAERSKDKLGDHDFGTLTSQYTSRYALVNQGFDVENISLKNQQIPADIAALVIADPKINFDPKAILKIQNYIASGGNLLIAGEPERKAILDPVIKPLGVRFADGMLVQSDPNNAPNLVMPFLTKAATAVSGNLKAAHRDSIPVTMPGAAALLFENNGPFHIEPLLVSSSKVSWLKSKKLDPDASAVLFQPEAGDLKKSFPTALSLSRMVNDKQQRIVITGDADFLSNVELLRSATFNSSNFEFATDLFGWFTYGQFPIDTSRPPAADNGVNITDGKYAQLQWLFFGILPALLLLGGTVFLVRRKRK